MSVLMIVVFLAVGFLSIGWAGWESWSDNTGGSGGASNESGTPKYAERRRVLAIAALIPLGAGLVAFVSSGLGRMDLILAATAVAFAASGLYILLIASYDLDLETKLRLTEERLRISEHRLVLAREENEQAAATAMETKRQFLTNMSHEMRTPLNGVIGAVGLLGDEEKTPEARLRYRDIIDTSARCLLQLVDNVLDFTLDKGHAPASPTEPFKLQATLAKASTVMDLAARQKELDLSVEMAPDIPQELSGDASSVLRIMLNLLDNAIKFTHHGSVTVRARLADPPASLSYDGTFSVRIWLRLEVEDTGVGIGENTEVILFEPLVQKDESMTRPQGGAGMGLAVSRRLARAMGGRIEFESRPDVGSTFALVAPFTVLDSEPESRGDSFETRRPTRQLLVVDDDPVSRLIAESQASSLGYEVDVVEDGLEAIEALRRRDYNAVLMDCRMPGLDGYETTRRWRGQESEHRLPVIAVTAHARENERERCLAAGMDDLLEKPVDTGKLEATLKRILPN